MAMSDGELRVEVAYMFGATDVHLFPSGHQMAFRSDLAQQKGEVIVGRWKDEGRGELWREVPDYPNDIKAAWKLVDYMLDHHNGWAFTLMTDRDGAGYWAAFDHLDRPGGEANGNRLDGILLDQRPGRAITRAFILAMEARREGA